MKELNPNFVNLDSSTLMLQKLIEYKKEMQKEKQDYEIKLNKLKELYEEHIRFLNEKINDFIKKHGYKTLEEIKIMDADKEYIGAEVNTLGYVTNTSAIDTFFVKKELPFDIKMGYYKIVDNELVLDEAMRARLWGD